MRGQDKYSCTRAESMKLEQLGHGNVVGANRMKLALPEDGSFEAKRSMAHPEVAELLNARMANKLVNCRSLARDEIELADFISNKLDTNPHYVPSETLLQAIRAINDRLASTSSLHGMVRTA